MDNQLNIPNRSVLFARLFLALAAALALIFPVSPALARSLRLSPEVIQVFVDDDFDSGTPGWGVDHFATIQEGVNAVDTGGFVDVAPGVYIEMVLISKPLALRGAEYGVDPRTPGARQDPNAETILRPPSFEPFFANLVTVHANNVTVDGFTFDGNNPALGNVGDLVNGVRLHIAGGVANGTEADSYATTVSGMDVANNIFKNLNLFGVTISSQTKTATSGHVIERNTFDNIPDGTTPYGSRRAIRLARNQYATITHNLVTRGRVGVEMTVFDKLNPGAASSISENDFQTVRDGIWMNQFIGTTSPILIDGNFLRTVPGTTTNNGITINIVKDTAQLQIHNNTVTAGAINGLQIFSLSSTTPLRVLNLDVQSPVENGILFSNKRENTLSSGAGRVLLDNVAINGGKTGVYVLDDISRPVTSTLTLTMTNDSEVTGSLVGLKVAGSGATLNLVNNDSATGISNNGTGILAKRSANLYAVGNNLDANQTGVVISGTLHVASLSQNWITDSTRYGLLMTSTVAGAGVIFNNDFSGSGILGAWNNTAATQDMSGNCWGSASPGVVAGKISGPVDYSPWLNNGTDTSTSAGFQGDFSSISVDDLATELSPSALQEGVTMAVEPGAVNVAPGTYPTGVTINKNIDLNMGGSVTITGAVVQNQGILTASPANLTLLGDLLRFGGTFNANNGTVTLFGAALQQIGGSSPTEFNHLLVANSAGVDLAGNVQVNGTLTLDSALLDVKTYDLTLGAGTAIAGDPPGNGNMIVTNDGGRLCKVFVAPGSFVYPVGDAEGTANYTPATIEFTSGIFTDAAACVGVIDARYPYNFATNHLTRYWTLAAQGISSYSANLSFSYASDGEDVVGLESALKELGFTGSTLSSEGDPVNTSANSMQITTSSLNGVTFTAGNSPPAVTITTMTITRLSPTSAIINWTVGAEANINGYNVWRSTSFDGPRTKVNSTLIPPGGPGHSYSLTDTGISTGVSYYYWLEVDSIDNNDSIMGPYILQWHKIFTPIIILP